MRRQGVRGSLERMTLLFTAPKSGSFWSRPQVLFFGELTILISELTRRLPRLP